MIQTNLARIVIILLISISSNFLAQNLHSDLSLMPAPKEIIITEGKFRITNQLEINISGNPDGRIYAAATRALRRLDARTGMFFTSIFDRKRTGSAPPIALISNQEIWLATKSVALSEGVPNTCT